MASSQLIVLASSLLLLSLAFPTISANETVPGNKTVPSNKTTEKKTEVVVEGIVYCQSCEHTGTWSLSGATPIPSAKVSVICKDHQDRVNFYKVFVTNPNGYFYAELDGFKMGNPLLDHPLQGCQVKLVSSPVENCNLLTNVNHGLYGAPLRYENKRLVGQTYEAVIYAAGPLAFRPAHCPFTAHN